MPNTKTATPSAKRRLIMETSQSEWDRIAADLEKTAKRTATTEQTKVGAL